MADAEYRHCVRCGTPYTPRHKIAMYCGNACKVAAHRKARPDLDQQRRARAEAERLAGYVPAPPRPALHSAHTHGWKRKKALQTDRGAKASQCCAVCRGPVGYEFGRPKSYCSPACYHQSEPQKSGRRAHRQKRKARQRGVTAHAVRAVDVFERDGWRCQMCGVPTPKARRGTTKPNAPELDHVHPLSKGGAHSMANLQCLCRSCNAWKSDRLIPAQSGLFTSLVAGGGG